MKQYMLAWGWKKPADIRKTSWTLGYLYSDHPNFNYSLHGPHEFIFICLSIQPLFSLTKDV